MSDFLTRMAQRSQGQTSVVNPRLPSSFSEMERVEARDILADDNQQSITPVHAQQTSNDLNAAPLNEAMPQRVSYRQHHIDQDAQTAPNLQKRKIPEKKEPMPLLGQNINKQQLLVTEKGVDINPQTQAQEEPSNKPYASLLTQKVRQSEGMSKPNSFDTNANWHDSLSNLRPNPKQVTLQYARQVQAQNNHPLVTKPSVQYVKAVSGLNETLTTSRRELKRHPSIHINIGRVEVRAHVTAPTAPPQRSSSTKVQSSLSLNDYLKRSGGRS